MTSSGLFMHCIIASLNKLNKSSGVPGLNREDAYKVSIPLPSLPEQHRIAAILTEQLTAVEQARKAAQAQLEASRALPAAYLREVFESEEAKSWQRVQLGNISLVSGGIQKTPARNPVDNFRPYLTVRNVQRGFLDLSVIEHFEISSVELERYRLQDKDILIVEGNGSKDQIGRNALFIEDGQEWIHQNHIIRVRFDSSVVSPEFASAYLNSDEGKAQMIDKAETTSGLYTLSTSKVNSLEIPIPFLDLQVNLMKRIEEKRTQIANITCALEEEYQAIYKISSALLRQAFTGAI